MIVVGPKDGFSEELAEKLGVDFVELEKRIFPDREICPRVLGQVSGRVVLTNRMSLPTDPNRYLTEFLITIKNLKELGAEKIDVLMPYFVYSRQDKIFRDGEPFSAKYVLELMKNAGATSFYCISSHLYRKEGEFSAAIPSFNISGFVAIANYLKTIELNDPIIIGPDKKSVLFAKEVGDILNCEYTSLEKTRDLDTGEIDTITKLDLDGHDAIIVDDIASSGGTLVNAIDNLKNPNKVICAVVHPVLTGDCLKKVSSKAEFIACNTIESPISKISVIDKITNFIG